jgi:hypothetical protein
MLAACSGTSGFARSPLLGEEGRFENVPVGSNFEKKSLNCISSLEARVSKSTVVQKTGSEFILQKYAARFLNLFLDFFF